MERRHLSSKSLPEVFQPTVQRCVLLCVCLFCLVFVHLFMGCFIFLDGKMNRCFISRLQATTTIGFGYSRQFHGACMLSPMTKCETTTSTCLHHDGSAAGGNDTPANSCLANRHLYIQPPRPSQPQPQPQQQPQKRKKPLDQRQNMKESWI